MGQPEVGNSDTEVERKTMMNSGSSVRAPIHVRFNFRLRPQREFPVHLTHMLALAHPAVLTFSVHAAGAGNHRAVQPWETACIPTTRKRAERVPITRVLWRHLPSYIPVVEVRVFSSPASQFSHRFNSHAGVSSRHLPHNSPIASIVMQAGLMSNEVAMRGSVVNQQTRGQAERKVRRQQGTGCPELVSVCPLRELAKRQGCHIPNGDKSCNLATLRKEASRKRKDTGAGSKPQQAQSQTCPWSGKGGYVFGCCNARTDGRGRRFPLVPGHSSWSGLHASLFHESHREELCPIHETRQLFLPVVNTALADVALLSTPACLALSPLTIHKQEKLSPIPLLTRKTNRAPDTDSLLCTTPDINVVHLQLDGVRGHRDLTAAVAERLDCSLYTKANRVQWPAGSLPDFRKSYREMPLVGGFSRGSLPRPPLHSGAAPFSPHFTLIGSQHLVWGVNPERGNTLRVTGFPAGTRRCPSPDRAALECKVGETGIFRENPQASGIVQHDSHIRKSGSEPVVGGERPSHCATVAQYTETCLLSRCRPLEKCRSRPVPSRPNGKSGPEDRSRYDIKEKPWRHPRQDSYHHAQGHPAQPGGYVGSVPRHLAMLPQFLKHKKKKNKKKSSWATLMWGNVSRQSYQLTFEVTLTIGLQFIRNAQDDSEPIADLQRNKHRAPYCQVWSNTGYSLGQQPMNTQLRLAYAHDCGV
ncbi:hypothetical protein PR048_022129 [Dryococelus australis]|uniref:Uncharacterized protein n=1 Tax=Dryococelus australis TaxID=614101 RepID=A0ABQ9H066_9NEOP|nr:hypothetical protein PR048_022129 [Dryococelus australis]